MSTNSKKKTTLLKVWRGGPGQEERYDNFNVPYEEGMSVLDALRSRDHASRIAAIRGEVEALCARFPVPGL